MNDTSKKTVLILMLTFLFVISGCQLIPEKLERHIPYTYDLQGEYKRAVKYYDDGLLTEAEWSLRKILEHNPDFDEAWFKLGNVYTRTNQLDAAENAFSKCTAINPDNFKCWNNLSIIHIKKAINVVDRAERVFDMSSKEHKRLQALKQNLIKSLK